MTEIARRWRVLAGGMAVGVAGVLGFAGATASAQPVFPQPPLPSPAITAEPAATPASAAVPGTLATPGGVAATTPAVLPAQPGQAVPPAQPAQAVPPPTITPASSGTLAEFFSEKGVKLEPQASHDFKALNIVLPMPKGWTQVPDPNVPDAFAVIADRVGGNGLYSTNAQVMLYKLVGEFDPKEAISHGFIDSQQLPAWRSTDASFADFYGMPSSVIEGTYRENSMTLNTSRRHLIASAGPDRYLVSLFVTTSVDQVVAAADATDAVVRGFKVSAPTPPGATPPDAAAQPSAPAPAQSPAALGTLPQMPPVLGVPG